MRDFYLQKIAYDGWGVNRSTERGILYTLSYSKENIGRFNCTSWYIKSPPFHVMYKLKVKEVIPY